MNRFLIMFGVVLGGLACWWLTTHFGRATSLLMSGVGSFAGILVGARHDRPPASPRRPNLIFIFSDQQHWQALGCRDPQFLTPHWDAFAADAARFDTVYCTTPLCSPSRATLLTGLLPRQHGVTNNGVPLRQSTIAPLLQKAGYRTAYFGKWHLRAEAVATAGWDVQQGVCDEYVKPNRPLSDRETCDFALAFLRQVDDQTQPFALFVSFDEPHGIYAVMPDGPYGTNYCPEPLVRPATQLPPSWQQPEAEIAVDWRAYALGPDRYRHVLGTDEAAWRRYRAFYRARVAAFDASLGELLAVIRARGLDERSVIVLTSDHGDMDAQHRLIFKGPLAYEQVQRVPLAIRVPAAWGGRGAAVNTRDLVSNADLFPTLLDFAGVAAPACAGLSLRPVLTGRADRHARQDAFIDYPNPALRTIRHQQWKYTIYPGVGPLLFNLDDDPDELHNRAGEPACRAVEEMLQARLQPNPPAPAQ